MEDPSRSEAPVPTEHSRGANISTENQPEGGARRPSATLDREPARDLVSGGSIPADYDPQPMTRTGEEQDSRAGRDGVGEENRRDKAGATDRRDEHDRPE